ncbi:amidohydrolase family protein [Cyclobacterium jeungdonense]|uniref:Amidohydrolase family protein n=1 Tax=Cyclobacterium jeungdonense TaxID=708087 RepID=A0ABT8C8G8_9BACT|nr:amidohydrolase family protein [Cyclobacterium jeungdonense]MDN3689044.1 amidohydrolase family protein [Cyclobacterium jeungdonense]
MVKLSKNIVFLLSLSFLFLTKLALAQNPSLLEVNPPEGPSDDRVSAIVNVRLIDGLGGPPLENAVVLIKGNRIWEAGSEDQLAVPVGAEITDGTGMSLLPGLMDSHLHNVNNNKALHAILTNGVTTVRDPGHPFRFYQSLHFAQTKMPRVYLTGAHLDGYPGVYLDQASLIRGTDHIRTLIRDYVTQGGSGIKIYFRLPLKYYETVLQTADFYRIPVVAHLELVDADDAIMAGLQGIEHITSFGTSLADPEDAVEFREAVRENSSYRRDGRYRLWSKIDLSADRVKEVLALAVKNKVVLSPTLTTFERQFGDEAYQAKAFQNMLDFVGMAHQAGVTVVTGSHNSGKYAQPGLAYQREMELLVAAGMTPLEAISSSTLQNARYFRTQDRLGSIEPGKLADLILVEGDPSVDIKAMYAIRKVMLNGEWVDREEVVE